jgi:hypothetical protein
VILTIRDTAVKTLQSMVYRGRESILAQAAAGYAGAGYFTIIDGIISPRWFFEPRRDTLQAAGHTVAYAVLRAPLAVCASRAASRDASRLTDTTVIEQLWSDFTDLGSLEHHAIASKDKSAEEVTKEVAERLRADLLDV